MTKLFSVLILLIIVMTAVNTGPAAEQRGRLLASELRAGSERFQDYTDEQLVLYGSKSGIGGPGETKVYGGAADPRYQIEMTRRLKENTALLNKNILKADSSIENMNNNILTVNKNIITLDGHIKELDRGTTYYSQVLTGLTVLMAIIAFIQVVLTFWQIKITRELKNAEQLIRAEAETNEQTQETTNERGDR